MWGGVVPDAVSVLVRLLASLHDDDGNVAVAGLHEGKAADLEFSAGPGARGGRPARRRRRDRLRLGAATALGQAGGHGNRHRHHIDREVVEHVDPAGAAPRSACGWLPAATRATHLDALTPPPRAARAVGRAGHRHAGRHRPAVRNRRQPARSTTPPAPRSGTAWGTEPVDMGVGGSIPFIAEFAAAFPAAKILVTGVEDPADPGAQHQREPAPRRAGAGRDGRGAAAGDARALEPLDGQVAAQLGDVAGGLARCTGRPRSCPSRRRRTSNGSRPERSCRTSSSRRMRPTR